LAAAPHDRGRVTNWCVGQTARGQHGSPTRRARDIVDLSSDLPLVLEWIDTEERAERLLPELEEKLQGGLITTDPVTRSFAISSTPTAPDPVPSRIMCAVLPSSPCAAFVAR
jgi:hypothetical protein